MKNLNEILANEKEHHTISSLAKSLGFKPDTIKLYFEKFKEKQPLNLVVEVDYTKGGNANNAHLLEAKLIDQFGLDVVVVIAGKVSDPLHKSELANGSFALEGEESKISQFLDRPLEDIGFRPSEIDNGTLQRHLKSAERTIKILAERAAASNAPTVFFSSSSSSALPLPRPVSSSKTAEIEDFLAPENKEMAREVLQNLPENLLLEVLNVFTLKRRQQEDENTAENKRHKSNTPPSPGPHIRVK